MRFYTAGESHGPGLTVFIDGYPAGVAADEGFVNAELARRQKGYGRGGRMRIETDTIKIIPSSSNITNPTRLCTYYGLPFYWRNANSSF